MGRKKKKQTGGEAVPSAPKVPTHISRPFADALKGVKAVAHPEPARANPPRHSKKESVPNEGAAKPSSPAPYGYEDRAAFNVAFADVAPLGAKQRGREKRAGVAPPQRVVSSPSIRGDAAARARLASLVADGLHFEVRREEDWIEGRRDDAPKSALADLRDGRATADAEIDLHGMTGDEAMTALVRFLRRERDRGRVIVRVIHGKGLHSSGGVGVLADRVLTAITKGRAAPLVHAFVTTSMRAGGSGALLIRLETR